MAYASTDPTRIFAPLTWEENNELWARLHSGGSELLKLSGFLLDNRLGTNAGPAFQSINVAASEAFDLSKDCTAALEALVDRSVFR